MGNIEIKHRQKCIDCGFPGLQPISTGLPSDFGRDYIPLRLNRLQLSTQKLSVGRSWKMGGGVGHLGIVDRGAIEAEWGCVRDKKRSRSLTVTSNVYMCLLE